MQGHKCYTIYLMRYQIPEVIMETVAGLRKTGFEAYIVGGAARDLIMGRKPKDWDITTSAKPDDIQAVFPDSVYENDFGTVGVKTRSEDLTLAVVEVTTFRKESGYSDHRHPDDVIFADKLEDDLSRRDFTVNAIAIDPEKKDDGGYFECRIIDLYGGQEDVKKKIIRAVGNADTRFKEDALRLVRAVRFSAELGFDIEADTMQAIVDNAGLLENIAKERIRDELSKIIMSDGAGAAWGIATLEKLGLLKNIMPELRDGINVGQNKHHIYTVWEHNLRALDYAAQNDCPLELRLGALLHDVGKPKVKHGDGPDSTFYNHEVVGARIAERIMDRLHYSKKITEKVVHLVRHHLFYYNVGEVTEAGVRRFINRVGEEYIDDLFKIREADRIGSGVPKAVPYKTRHLRFMMDKVRRDPVAPKMLALRGDKLMEMLGIGPGPRIGMILSILLEEVLDDPKLNETEGLSFRARELAELSDNELAEKKKKATERKEEYEAGVEKEIKRKHKV